MKKSKFNFIKQHQIPVIHQSGCGEKFHNYNEKYFYKKNPQVTISEWKGNEDEFRMIIIIIKQGTYSFHGCRNFSLPLSNPHYILQWLMKKKN